ncbi:MAG: class I SAM-dependent methyltransferase [Flavobacterium sp.]|uniref:class I SAM-dependent methyltransferase n=1 Tax=Flavobacterium sp. TaxID=239 RepID=UPI0012298C09|nr:class I SAM-dependent methyltransferase [Flavobacterium sp.]RZJ66657.1 MAG: class I SAM-dependent methyltransferase [Flavobacterium sp.]
MKKSTLEVFNENALKYQTKFMKMDLYDATYIDFLSRLKSNAEILEIGCGPGNITRYFLDKRADLKILATDFAPAMVELAEKNNPEVECIVLDARHISSLERNFDAIVCGFIVPYFSREEFEKLVCDSVKVLNTGDLFYISCIEGDYDKSGWMASSDGKVSAFVHYYDENDIRKILSMAGFSVLETFRVAYENSIHLVVIAKIP